MDLSSAPMELSRKEFTDRSPALGPLSMDKATDLLFRSLLSEENSTLLTYAVRNRLICLTSSLFHNLTAPCTFYNHGKYLRFLALYSWVLAFFRILWHFSTFLQKEGGLSDFSIAALHLFLLRNLLAVFALIFTSYFRALRN